VSSKWLLGAKTAVYIILIMFFVVVYSIVPHQVRNFCIFTSNISAIGLFGFGGHKLLYSNSLEVENARS